MDEKDSRVLGLRTLGEILRRSLDDSVFFPVFFLTGFIDVTFFADMGRIVFRDWEDSCLGFTIKRFIMIINQELKVDWES